MTRTSNLFSGGSGAKYKSGVFYPAVPLSDITTNALTLGRDYLVAFSPRSNVTVSEVAWKRITTNAANVYVGIYSFTGTLLTDCAVDANTVVGMHAVATTPVTLIANEWYWLAVNTSVGTVFVADTVIASDAQPQFTLNGRDAAGFYLDAGAVVATLLHQALYKARANAALTTPLTITGFTESTEFPFIGIVPQ